VKNLKWVLVGAFLFSNFIVGSLAFGQSCESTFASSYSYQDYLAEQKDTDIKNVEVFFHMLLDYKSASLHEVIPGSKLAADILLWFRERAAEDLVNIQFAENQDQIDLALMSSEQTQIDFKTLAYGRSKEANAIIKQFQNDVLYRSRAFGKNSDFVKARNLLGGRHLSVAVFDYLLKDNLYVSIEMIMRRYLDISNQLSTINGYKLDEVLLAIYTHWSLEAGGPTPDQIKADVVATNGKLDGRPYIALRYKTLKTLVTAEENRPLLSAPKTRKPE
jgi:hypothetical protein